MSTAARLWSIYVCIHLVAKLFAMQKTIFLFLCCTLVLSQCRSLRSADFHTSPALPTRLPPLRLLIHQTSFGQAFDAALYRQGPGATDPWQAYSVTAGAMQDVTHLLQNELADNVMQVGKNQAGQARFKLLFYERRNTGWGYAIPSILTLSAANILGMPYGTIRCELELQLEIADAKGKPIVTYSAPGTGRAKIAMYYGYVGADAIRKANLEALKTALKAIEIKLQEDVPTLSAQLAGG